jgi:TIR domain-containing protein
MTTTHELPYASTKSPQPPAPQLRWPKIFLCYRREDTQWAARGIYETLSAKYGHERVFRDIDSTPAGVKYSTWIESRVGQCNVMIVLIGDGWSSARDDTGQRRLDLPKDWVRQEIEAALKRDIPIIPVRVQGARMPSDDELPSSIADLTGFQSAEVTDSRWTYDVGLLIRSIDDLIESGEKK